MLGGRYEVLSDDERARRRIDAAAFIAEEASVRTGTPPFAVADIQAPVVYGRSDGQVMPIVVDFLRSQVPSMEVVTLPGAGHHAHRTAPRGVRGSRAAGPRGGTPMTSLLTGHPPDGATSREARLAPRVGRLGLRALQVALAEEHPDWTVTRLAAAANVPVGQARTLLGELERSGLAVRSAPARTSVV